MTKVEREVVFNSENGQKEMTGVRHSDDDVKKLIEQEQQALQEQQQTQEAMALMQAAAPAAQAAKNMTEAANDGNPAMAAWLGMGGGAGEV